MSRDAEVYLVGSIARNDLHKAHDIDILVVTKTPPRTVKEHAKIVETVRKKSKLTRHHPVDIHFTHPRDKSKWLKHSRKYKLLTKAERE